VTAPAASKLGKAGLALVALLSLAVQGGCRDRQPAVATCADPLTGVWKTADGHGYHIEENRTGIEIFAMFDTTVPPGGDKRTAPVIYAPIAFDLRRASPPGHVGLTGRRTQRMTRGGNICTMRTKAVIDRCEDNEIALRYERPGALDWTTCKHEHTNEWVELSLHRQ